MTTNSTDAGREKRMSMDIFVEACGGEEQALGWYCYLEETLQCPFLARCTAERATSPFRKGDEVEVIALTPEEE